MSQRNRQAKDMIHPKISAIQNHINYTMECFRKKDYSKAVEEMELTTMELFPVDQDEDFIKKLEQELSLLFQIKYDGTKRNWEKEHSKKYKQWFRELQKHIADCGYWTAEKYVSMSLHDLRKENSPSEL
ncbi:MAG TPA: hypothetical protein VMX17_00295 [Candidatus Glassbacteria bacterium]|nr:hypothetical protein [Candidatus Glassbacteria bacterium]